MRREPDPLAFCIVPATRPLTLIRIAAIGFPGHALPRVRKRVFTFISANGYTKLWIVAVIHCPAKDLARYFPRIDVVNGIAVLYPVRRVEHYSGHAYGSGRGWTKDTLPINAANPHPSQIADRGR